MVGWRHADCTPFNAAEQVFQEFLREVLAVVCAPCVFEKLVAGHLLLHLC